MRFAILGTRGIPARYGGFETFAEELSTRLRCRGHTLDGVLPGAASGSRNIAASACSICPRCGTNIWTPSRTPCFPRRTWRCGASGDASRMPCCTATRPTPCSPGFRAWLGMPVALNVDGLERNRKKWNAAGQGVVSNLGVAGDVDAQRGGHRCAKYRGLLSGALSRDPQR